MQADHTGRVPYVHVDSIIGRWSHRWMVAKWLAGSCLRTNCTICGSWSSKNKANDRQMINIVQLYREIFIGPQCHGTFTTYKQHKMSESTNENTANLLIYLFPIYQLTNFSILPQHLHHCITINKATCLPTMSHSTCNRLFQSLSRQLIDCTGTDYWQTRNPGSLATAEIARDVWNGHSRSLKVIHCCANRHGTYDFLSALITNLTSIFNRSWDIMPSLHKAHPYPSLLGGTGKRQLGVCGHALVSGCREHWTIQP